MDNNSIIKVEGLSKKYLLNKNASEKSDTLFGSFINGLKNVKNISQKKEMQEFWALKDVSFNVQQGDRVGVIGRNGAGKSTLLKILSRITPPTSGRVEINGRLASLLEVGTGFHGDLSGRENIYLNGSILGMNKHEIDKKFDEIVDFSEIEKFLDTPVKRYSSGMYVRLAFAIAAHLEPEILIVDEVLAVGDAEFQRKCLGKMQDVSSEGRTILFVSHNIASVISLCNKGLLMEKGTVKMDGDITSVVNEYNFSGNRNSIGLFVRPEYDEHKHLVSSVELLDKDLKTKRNFNYGDKIFLKIKTNPLASDQKFGLTIKIKNAQFQPIGFFNSWINDSEKVLYTPGEVIIVELDSNNFTQDRYLVDIICNDWNKYHVDNFWDEVSFEIDHCKPKDSTIFIDSSKELGNVILQNVKIYSEK
ncbi:MAG: ABC transporter ATP-binding protein [Bacteroidota bacterium]